MSGKGPVRESTGDEEKILKQIGNQGKLQKNDKIKIIPRMKTNPSKNCDEIAELLVGYNFIFFQLFQENFWEKNLIS